jgi:hypothetical protein
MEVDGMKKYQFFISSTYEDLKEERNAVIYSILNASQFPVGMEMFSASDDDQWQVIVESIDSSDYFVLIVGNKYGSIDDETGISYTEKEFDYAVSKGIPILAFIVDKSVPMTSDRTEQEQEKIKMLKAFKDKVLSHRYVKHWKSIDDLKFLISQSIANEIIRAKRPGWIRATELDGIDYKDDFGEEVHLECDDIRLFRYVYRNSVIVKFKISNVGNIRATDVRVNILFPDELLVMSEDELEDYYGLSEPFSYPDSNENYKAKFYSPNEKESATESADKFITIDELVCNDDIAELLNPYDDMKIISIYPSEVNLDVDEVRHKDCKIIDGACVLPTKAGTYTIKCKIICNEYDDVIEQDIVFEVD